MAKTENFFSMKLEKSNFTEIPTISPYNQQGSSISFLKNVEKVITGFTKKKIYMLSKSTTFFTTKIIFWMSILWSGQKV